MLVLKKGHGMAVTPSQFGSFLPWERGNDKGIIG